MITRRSMRVGLLFKGDEVEEIWGSAITTLYLAEAIRDLGHEAWRASVTVTADWSQVPIGQTDFIISEGVPAGEIPAAIWEAGIPVVLWCLSSLYYEPSSLDRGPFDGVAANSRDVVERLTAVGVRSKFIEVAASAGFAAIAARPEYRGRCVYLGCYPHKASDQMDLVFCPAAEYGLKIWGYGWEDSPYAKWYCGPLPLRDIPDLYHSADIVLALTERRQMARGMINNRVFEALACGAVVVSDPHPGLAAHALGNFVNFVDSQADTEEVLRRFYKEPGFASRLREKARAGQSIVLSDHTYRSRADQFLGFGSVW